MTDGQGGVQGGGGGGLEPACISFKALGCRPSWRGGLFLFLGLRRHDGTLKEAFRVGEGIGIVGGGIHLISN